MIRAKVKVGTLNRTAARSIVESVQPENLNLTGLRVNSKVFDHAAYFDLKFDGKIETFISTVDDLLRCLQAAEGTLNRVVKLDLE